MFRFAHISDLHLSKISLNPLQFFTKKCIGNINLLFIRKNLYKKSFLYQLPNLFKELDIEYVKITEYISSKS